MTEWEQVWLSCLSPLEGLVFWGPKVLKAQLHQRKEKPTPGGDKVGEEGIKGERACARTQPDLPLDLFKQMPDTLSPRESLNLRSYTASSYFSPNSNGLSSSL